MAQAWAEQGARLRLRPGVHRACIQAAAAPGGQAEGVGDWEQALPHRSPRTAGAAPLRCRHHQQVVLACPVRHPGAPPRQPLQRQHALSGPRPPPVWVQRFRFTTSLLFSAAVCLEFLTPLAPQHFLLLASTANVGKSVGLATYLACMPAFQKSFALGENLADLNAKSQVHPAGHAEGAPAASAAACSPLGEECQMLGLGRSGAAKAPAPLQQDSSVCGQPRPGVGCLTPAAPTATAWPHKRTRPVSPAAEQGPLRPPAKPTGHAR